MLFSDPEFLFFFLPFVLAVNLILPRAWRNAFLLIASLTFYSAGEGPYVGILICFILFNHAVALAIDRSANRKHRRTWLALGVTADLFLLMRFKYLDFMIEVIADVLPGNWDHPKTHLPIGISFFTFQAISYLVDVYRREMPAIRSLLDFATYKSLFPQLIAGPIVRAKTVYHELENRRISADDFASGAQRFVVGLAKKLVIADTLAIAADAAFGATPNHLTTGLAWIGLLCYTLQIYYDFSGYSDMAIGIGRMLGFHFLENFRYPYAARSVSEFWRRWHISLSTWFRDYLYIPLGGSRISRQRTYFNLIIVFLLCGLWHGANWTFVLWGAWHGLFLILERMGLSKWLHNRNRFIQNGYLLTAVMTGWVWFRASSLQSAGAFFMALAGHGAKETDVRVHFGADLWCVLAVAILLSWPTMRWINFHWLRSIRNAGNMYREQSIYLAGRLIGAAAMLVNLVLALMQTAAGTHNPFIYFRF